jgi:demethylmenaquinone methyltransferase/2-methoxy-6-polyprenyl-1,4-benzoquinol methylase
VGKLLDGGQAALHRLGERRPRRRAESVFEPPRRSADTVEVGGLSENRWGADRLLEGKRCVLGLLDTRRTLGQSERDQPLAELSQLSPARALGGQLTERRDRHGPADGVAARQRLPAVVQDDPRPLLAEGEGAEIGALASLGLGRDNSCELLAGPGKARSGGGGTVEIVPERHGGKHRLGVMALSERSRVARELFAPLGPTYDRWSRLLSLGQDPRWRRFLVSRIEAGPGDEVLDVATGTAAVAIELARGKGCRVVGLDQSAEMLAAGRRRVEAAGLAERVRLVEGSAVELPFEDGSFDGLTFTYLLRYVEQPAATLRELARVVRPGGAIAALEFGLPRGLWRPLWELYVRVGLPVAGRLISPGWHEVGAFLGPSIREFHARLPLAQQLELWRAAGIDDPRVRRLSLGGGYVMWGRRA